MAKTLQVIGASSYGGASYLVIKWCHFLVDQGWQVDVLATDQVFVQELKGIAGIRVWQHIVIPRDIEPYQDLQAFHQLVSLIGCEKYDVVHTYTATPGFIGRIASRLVGVPVILHHQAGWNVTEFSRTLERLIYTPLEYLATLASTKSICVSQAVAQQAQQLRIAPVSRLVTICNGIDPRPFILEMKDQSREAVRAELDIPQEQVLLGSTGRLAPQKDIGTLIRSMVFLRSLLSWIPITLLLIGDGPDRQSLEDLVHSLDLDDHVQFLGFRKDIARILASLDVFVSPSLREGLSISLLEAMAAARPIVATSILPNAELIEHEVTGLLVSPRQAELMAHAIARFVNDPDLAQRCGAAALQRVLERYTIERMFAETRALYDSLLAQRKHEAKDRWTTAG